MTVSTSEPPTEFWVACQYDFPRCLQGTFSSNCFAVKASECACHVARDATKHLLPQVTIKEPA